MIYSGGNLSAGSEAQPMVGLRMRAQRAAADLAEALSLNQPPPQQPGQPPQGAQPGPPGAPPMPMGQPPMQGALRASAQGAPPMGQQRPGASPLQTMPSMHSPPMEAVLQGPQGAQGAVKPVGFARGGLAVFRGR